MIDPTAQLDFEEHQEAMKSTRVVKTELDVLLDRVREDRADPTGKNRNAVAYDCWRMFEDLATRYKEEFAMRDRYKARSNSWRDRALRQASLLAEVAALDDGDEQFAWKHEDLFNRIRAEVSGE
jgi:hypothetical protein